MLFQPAILLPANPPEPGIDNATLPLPLLNKVHQVLRGQPHQHSRAENSHFGSGENAVASNAQMLLRAMHTHTELLCFQQLSLCVRAHHAAALWLARVRDCQLLHTHDVCQEADQLS